MVGFSGYESERIAGVRSMGFEEDLKARRVGIEAEIEKLRARVATL
tara:strand:+ start:411 stop:548 length:138 start_codon:yes stop_codon:yes gene_type:complete